MPLPDYGAIELPLLREILAAGGEIRPRDVFPRMRQHFPGVPDADFEAKLSTGGNAWTNRIQFARERLVKKGDLYREPYGVWRLTSQGEVRARGEASLSTVTTEPPTNPAPAPHAAITVVSDQIDIMCTQLITAQSQSSSPKNFETILAEAFRFLGFDVQTQGKSGETDVLLNTHLGAGSYRVVVDAKATHGDRVSDSQIRALDHRNTPAGRPRSRPSERPHPIADIRRQSCGWRQDDRRDQDLQPV